MRGADRYAEMRRAQQSECARSLGGEAAKRVEFRNALAHSLDDSPASRHRAATHRQVAADNHPIGNRIAFQEATGRESGGDDAHALLSVVGTVTQAISSRRDELQA